MAQAVSGDTADPAEPRSADPRCRLQSSRTFMAVCASASGDGCVRFAKPLASGAGGCRCRFTLKPGTKLVREWHGQVHTVDVLDDGFAYQGERYPSLTRIARRITGVQWSGPRFFGVNGRRPMAEASNT